jgi:hypothetical protein
MKGAQFKTSAAREISDLGEEEFQRDWGFLSNTVFNEKHDDRQTRFDGKLWVQEMFLLAQSYSPKLPKDKMMMAGMMFAILHPVVSKMLSVIMAMKMGSDDGMKEKEPMAWLYWVYTLPMIMGNTFYFMMNFQFLVYAQIDIQRRNYQMHLLSDALCVDFQQKNSINVRLPTINFMDPKSVTTWLEARRLVMDVGSRFAVRIQIYLTIYLTVVGIGVLLLFLALSGNIDASALGWADWISLTLIILYFVILCVQIMFPYAYINEQSKYQIESFLALKSSL